MHVFRKICRTKRVFIYSGQISKSFSHKVTIRRRKITDGVIQLGPCPHQTTRDIYTLFYGG